ncbi:MAG: ParB N-terminal domain-containing protein [Hyphomicrobiales bacterium]|nr:ParB N-terminal domain-containing protein [Hyphomicrobiales bacterium]MBV9520205.1 ParB N-terminal domain-containing protein [Hyphomicrobiales bacterium]
MKSQHPTVQIGFEPDCVVVPLSRILPVKTLRRSVKDSQKYRQIAASIAEVGLVELPVITRHHDPPDSYLLLDGHLRVEILKDMGKTEVQCLVSTEDENYTYNKRISRLAAVQEHQMMKRAMANGVSHERLARALNINVGSLQRRVRMLEGVCAEALNLLKDKPCPVRTFEVLKKMTPLRQIEAAELLINANNFSAPYASAIYVSTPQDQLVNANQPKRVKGMTPEAIGRMERELARLQQNISSIEERYGTDNLHLTVARGYLTKLLCNARVVQYLSKKRPEFLSEFQNIVDMTSTLPSEAGD